MNDNINLKQVSFETLVLDSSFKEWVEQSNRESVAYWNSYVADNPAQADTINMAKEFLLTMNAQKAPLSNEEIDSEVELLLGKTQHKESKVFELQPQKKRFGWFKAVAAAVIIVVAGTVFFFVKDTFSSKALSKVTLKGEKTTVELSDGSTVIMNVDSRLDYPEKFNDRQRLVDLKGEAMFNIKRDENRPFIVKTSDIDIQVLGTSFNISTYANDEHTTVELLTGAVMVKLNDKEKNIIALRPFEKLIYDKPTRQWKIESFETEDVAGWKDGVLYFNNTSIDEIVKELERWFDVKITIHNPENIKAVYSGKFKTTSLEKIMNGVCFTWNASYQVKGKNVVISFQK